MTFWLMVTAYDAFMCGVHATKGDDGLVWFFGIGAVLSAVCAWDSARQEKP